MLHLSRPLTSVECRCGLLWGEGVDRCVFAEPAYLEGCVERFSAGFEIQPVEFGEAGAWLTVNDDSRRFGNIRHGFTDVLRAVFRWALGVKVGGVGVDGELDGKAQASVFD